MPQHFEGKSLFKFSQDSLLFFTIISLQLQQKATYGLERACSTDHKLDSGVSGTAMVITNKQ